MRGSYQGAAQSLQTKIRVEEKYPALDALSVVD